MMNNLPEAPKTDYLEDEIDLFELIQNIWRGKFLILSTIFIFVVVAVVYLFIATPQYKIQAQIKSSNSTGLSIKDIASWFNNEFYRDFFHRNILTIINY